MKILDRVQL